MTRTDAAAPTADRIEAMDALRGVALFGILLMNIAQFGLPYAYSDPSVYGGDTGADLWSWIILQMGFEGTQRGLFSILFGAGVILMTSRLEAAGRNDAADIYFRRNLWLVLFGVIHAYILLWTGEILFFYGVTALFLYAFRKLPPRHLFAIGAAGLLVIALWNVGDARHAIDLAQENAEAEAILAGGGELTKEQEASKEEWDAYVGELKPDADKIAEAIEARKGGYLKVLTHQAPEVVHFESWMLYRYFFDIFSMMLFGMAFFKMGVLTLGKKKRVYALMALIGYGVGLTVNYFETTLILKNNFSVEAIAEAQITYDVGRVAMTVGHLGAILLFFKSGLLSFLRRALAAVGRMALTNYVSHSIICAFIFYGFGFGLYGDLQRHQLYYVVFGIWLFQLVVSPLWLARFRFGPLEWGWRALTYMRRPRMRLGGRAEPAAQAV